MFTLRKSFADQMIAQAREEFPNECCGILSGKDGMPLKLHPTTNIDASPVRYTIDPKEMYQIYKEAESQGWDLVAFYHSHTHSEAYPSLTDVRLATWPDSIYMLVSLRDYDSPKIRAFHIVDGKITEVELRIQ